MLKTFNAAVVGSPSELSFVLSTNMENNVLCDNENEKIILTLLRLVDSQLH